MARGRGEVVIRPFRPEDQAAAKSLILAGLEAHWGFLDPTRNPDLDDITSTYAGATFLLSGCDPQIRSTVENGIITLSTSLLSSVLQAFIQLAAEADQQTARAVLDLTPILA